MGLEGGVPLLRSISVIRSHQLHCLLSFTCFSFVVSREHTHRPRRHLVSFSLLPPGSFNCVQLFNHKHTLSFSFARFLFSLFNQSQRCLGSISPLVNTDEQGRGSKWMIKWSSNSPHQSPSRQRKGKGTRKFRSSDQVREERRDAAAVSCRLLSSFTSPHWRAIYSLFLFFYCLLHSTHLDEHSFIVGLNIHHRRCIH